MENRTRIIIGLAIVGAGTSAAIGAVAAGTSHGSGDHEVPITGEALERASAVALDHLGEGRVTETEEGDEDSYYEVEVTLDNGDEVDVQLDRQFNVVGAETDTPDRAGDD